MRDFKGMKRQRGRNRGGSSGNKPQQHNANRAFDSNGPEGVKVRGAAQGVFEKYQQLARDAAQGGDRVLAENHLQHAEHYFRVLRAMQPARPVTDFIGREATSGFDIDFEAEPEEIEATAEPEAAETENDDRQRDERPRFDRQRDDRQREDRPRDDRPRDGQQRDGQPRDDRPRDGQQRDRFEGQGQGQGRRDRWRERDDRPRDGQQRDGQPRDDRPASEAREDRPREDRPRDDRPRDERPREDRAREDRPREDRPQRARYDRGDRQDRGEARDPLAVVEPQATPLTAQEPAEGSPRLRGQDGAVSELPAFLGRSSAPVTASVEAEAPAAEAAPKPRRRRAPRAEGPAETGDA